mgnify:CR=1 FL=1
MCSSDLAEVKGRRVVMSAEALLGGQRAVTARATFVQVPLEHFLRHGNSEQIAQAVRDREARLSALGLGVAESEIQVNP